MNLKKSLSLLLITSLSTNSFAVSIAQLIQQGELPAIRDKVLNMSGMNITSLEGLADIPGIGEIEGLGLNDNDVTHISARAFASCKNLKVLGLKNNKITSIDVHALDGLDQLEVLYLENNKVAVLDPKTVNRLPKLKLMAVNKNPLPVKDIQKLRKALPNVSITKGFINKQVLTAIGVSIGVIIVALAVAFGVRGYQAKQAAAETERQKQEEKRKAAAFEASPKVREMRQLALKKEEEAAIEAANLKKVYELNQGYALMALGQGNYTDFHLKKAEAIKAFRDYYKIKGWSTGGGYQDVKGPLQIFEESMPSPDSIEEGQKGYLGLKGEALVAKAEDNMTEFYRKRKAAIDAFKQYRTDKGLPLYVDRPYYQDYEKEFAESMPEPTY